jgi:hypothetical protein
MVARVVYARSPRSRTLCRDYVKKQALIFRIARPEGLFKGADDFPEGEIDDPEAYASGIVCHNTHFDHLEL